MEHFISKISEQLSNAEFTFVSDATKFHNLKDDYLANDAIIFEKKM